MTDLQIKCPKCNIKLSRYIHSVDSCGMGDYIPDGKYKMQCKPSGYMNTDKEEKYYCGHEFNVKAETRTVVTALPKEYGK